MKKIHSDRGWAYQMGAYSCALKENKIYQSMSRKGNCYDNSVETVMITQLWKTFLGY